MVIFSRGFWDSQACKMELELTVKLAEDGRIAYVPVFMYSTAGEVSAAALNHAGKDFSDMVGILAHALSPSLPLLRLHKKKGPLEISQPDDLAIICPDNAWSAGCQAQRCAPQR